MRVIVVLSFSISLLLLVSCESSKLSPPATYENTIATAEDSIKKKDIQLRIEELNNAMAEHGPPMRFAFPVRNPTDTISYWLVDGVPARISAPMANGEGILWPTFYYADSQLLHVRYRVLVKNDTAHYAAETMTYLKDGKIVFAEDRHVSLGPDQIAAVLRQKSYTVSSRTFGDLETDFAATWAKVKPAVDSHFVNNPPIAK
jgi:hypothetical protein